MKKASLCVPTLGKLPQEVAILTCMFRHLSFPTILLHTFSLHVDSHTPFNKTQHNNVF